MKAKALFNRILSAIIVGLMLLSTTKSGAADFFWVGGSGNWSDFANHWATTSGGATFRTQVPSSADNVIFDANSFASDLTPVVTMDLTLATCEDMTWSGVVNNPKVQHINVTDVLQIFGSLTFDPNMDWQYKGRVSFSAFDLGNTITSNGQAFRNDVSFNQAGGEWIIQDAFELIGFGSGFGLLSLTKGTLNTNGQDVTTRFFNSSNSNVRTLIIDNSHIFVSGSNVRSWNISNPTNITFSSTGSTIELTSTTFSDSPSSLESEGLIYNDVILADKPTGAVLLGTNTYNNLTCNGSVEIREDNSFNQITIAAGKSCTITAGKTQTLIAGINATGTCTAPVEIITHASGSPVFITQASGAVTVTGVILEDVQASGGATFTANNSFDIGINTGWTITPATAQTLYWVGGTGDWGDVNHWSLSSGGLSAGCLPSPIDNVIFDANSFSAAGETVTVESSRAECHDMDWSAIDDAAVFQASFTRNKLNIHGSLTLSSIMDWDYNAPANFRSRHPGETITGAGQRYVNNVSFVGHDGEWILQDAFLSDAFVFVQHGTFRTNDKDLECSLFNGSSNYERSIYLGASTVFMTQNYFVVTILPSHIPGLTFDAGTSTIRFSGAFPQLNLNASDPRVYHNVIFEPGTPAGIIVGNNTFNDVTFLKNGKITGNNTYNNLTLSAGNSFSFPSFGIQTINSSLNAVGNCASLIEMKGSSTGHAARISKSSGAVTVDFVLLQDMEGTGGATFTANNSIDGGGNIGWTINLAPGQDFYWTGGTGNWGNTANWSLMSGDPSATNGCLPGPNDNVFFDANSFSAPGQVVTIDEINAWCHNMDWTGATGTPQVVETSNSNLLRIWGSLKFISAMDFAFDRLLIFESRDPGNTITLSGQTIRAGQFNGPGEWTMLDQFETTGGITLMNNLSAVGIQLLQGTLRTNGQNVICSGGLWSVGNLPRTLELGNSTVTLQGTTSLSGTWRTTGSNLTFDAGTSLIEFAYPFPNFNFGNVLYATGFDFHDVVFTNPDARGTLAQSGNTFNSCVFNGHGTLSGANTFESLTLSPGKSYSFASGVTQTITPTGTFNATGTPAMPITIGASTAGSRGIIYKDGGLICLNYLSMRDNEAQGSASFFAGPNSSNIRNNLGWSFDFCTPPVIEACDGDSVCFDELDLSIGSWDWNFGDPLSGANNTSNLPDPCHTFTAPGTYEVYVDVFNVNEETSDRIRTEVVVKPLPTVAISPAGPVAFCDGESTDLTASGAASYLWSTGETTESITVSAEGSYSVTGTDAATGCENSDVVDVTVNPLPVIEITPDGPAAFCEGGSVKLEASGGTSYEWSTGETTAAITVNTSGTYSVTGKDANGCTNSASIDITVYPPPVVDAGADVTITTGQSTTLSATASEGTSPYTFVWSTTETTASITVSPTVTTTYSVTVTDANGCTATDDVTVTVEIIPTCSDFPCGNKGQKVLICHIPPGNPGNAHEICISQNAVQTHIIQHGDYCGPCITASKLSGSGDKADEPDNSIPFESSKQVMIYPNPNNGSFKIMAEGDAITSVSVFDVLGKEVYKKEAVSAFDITVDISDRSGGIYFISVTQGDRVTTGKIIYR